MRQLLADIRKWSARRLTRLAAAIDPMPEPTPEPAATTPGPATAVGATPEPEPPQAEPSVEQVGRLPCGAPLTGAQMPGLLPSQASH